jgi:DNA-binding IclR family transcriptional regulator
MMEDADVLPFHLTASGAAVLAHHPDAARIIGSAPDPQALQARVDAARRTGWAETISTFEKDVHGLAVPLFDVTGTCTGAVAVAAAAPRMTPALHAIITAELAAAGDEINRLRGGQPRHAPQ